MSKTSILYFIPSLSSSGGMEKVLTEKANYLAELPGFEVTILTTDMEDNEFPYFLLNKQINIIKLNLFFNKIFNLGFVEKTIKMFYLINQYRTKIENLFKQNSFDICVSMGGKEIEFLFKIDTKCIKIIELHFSKGLRGKIIREYRGNNFFWKLIILFREFQEIRQLKAFDRVVVLNEKSKEDWKLENIEVIPNPSSIAINNQSPNFDTKRCIAVGRLEFEKGYDLLIRSWVEIKAKHPDWTLDIFGNGSKRHELDSLIKDLNLDGVVTLKGLTNQVKKELLASELFVLSSRFEGMPMVMLESMSCGLPMVAFDCETGPSELISNNDCGLLVSNGDYNALSISILKLINNKELRLRMSNAAKSKVVNYSVENIMHQWIKLFNFLLLK